MRYCMMNGGVREICDCSYQQAQTTIEPAALETVVKTLSAGVRSDEKVIRKMNKAVQDCAKKVEKGELKVERPKEKPPVTTPVPPPIPTNGIMPPPPPPPVGGAAVPPAPPAPIAIPLPPEPKKDEISIDSMENPAKTEPVKTVKKKKKKAAPKKEEQTYFGQYDAQFLMQQSGVTLRACVRCPSTCRR